MGSSGARTLCLMRHGKSSWADESLTDIERPLNERGRTQVPEIALRLKAAGIRPSLIMASSAKRTWSTAKLAADVLGYPHEFLHRERDLYLADVATLREHVVAQDARFRCLLLCGHNPGLTEFVAELAPGLTDNVPTSAVACFTAHAQDWPSFFEADVSLARYETPKLAWPAS
ncbi:MAG: histidine phosphatase family protein [Pseudomonadota bacterium]